MLSAAQLEQRRGKIGSSMIPAIVGLDAFAGPMDAWLELMGRADKKASPQSELGHELEPLVGRWAAKQLGVEVEHSNETFIHPDHEWACATPDFLTLPDRQRAIEAKNVGWRMVHRWLDDAEEYEPPLYVQIQTQWQIWVCGLEGAWIAAFLGGRDRRVWPVVRDDDVIADLASIAEDFYKRYVLADVPPVDASESAAKYLRERYRKHGKDLVPATAEAVELVRAYQEAREAEKQAEEKKKLAQHRLMEVVGDAGGIRGDFGTVKWIETKESHVSFTKPASRHIRVFPAKGMK